MIHMGLNGRTEGTFLVNELLSAKKILVPKEKLLFQDGHHRLSGVEFTDGLREDEDLKASLTEITEDLIRLFYEVEKDERLIVPMERIGGTIKPYIGYEDLTGMTFLNLFSNRFLSLEEREDGTTEVKAIPLVFREIPGARQCIDALQEDIRAFSERTAGTTDPFSESVLAGLPEREKIIRRNAKGTLAALHDMMKEMDEETDLVRAEDVLSGLTFSADRYLGIGDIRIRIPDGFRSENDTDGHRAILYRPNEENPDVYESAGIVYFLDTDEKGNLSISAAARVEEDRREETEKQLEEHLWGHVFRQ